MEQRVIYNYEDLDKWISDKKRILLVCDSSLPFLKISRYFDDLSEKIVFFNGFQPNPLYESVVKGTEAFKEKQCDSIIAVGGGSAIDVAKCIKLYSNMEGDGSNGDYLKQEYIANDIPFLAIPTTAGTGSEATRYAVIYYEGNKQSITSESFIPETVLMDSNVLKTLPEYQKKSTMLDALCHAIESYWSVNSTVESRILSKDAIRRVVTNMDGYLANTDQGNTGMLLAANTAGKAINITQTTAGHAMCYKITSIFGCAHGHAAALCLRVLYPWMLDNTDKCCDPRGEEYLKIIFKEIAEALGCKEPRDGAIKFNDVFDSLDLEIPKADDTQLAILKESVNPVRLKNHPIRLDIDTIDYIYHRILNGEE